MTISEQLRAAIRQYGGAYRVAWYSGIDRAVLSRFLAGTRGLRIETADRLASFFGLSLTRQETADVDSPHPAGVPRWGG